MRLWPWHGRCTLTRRRLPLIRAVTDDVAHCADPRSHPRRKVGWGRVPEIRLAASTFLKSSDPGSDCTPIDSRRMPMRAPLSPSLSRKRV